MAKSSPIPFQVRPDRLFLSLAGLVYHFRAPQRYIFSLHFMKSFYGSLLLFSIAVIVTAGPLPTRPVVDVRLVRNPGVDDSHLPSTGRVWQIVSDSIGLSADYLPENDFVGASDFNDNSDHFFGIDKDVALVNVVYTTTLTIGRFDSHTLYWQGLQQRRDIVR